MEMEAKGKARNMIIVRGYKGEVKKLRERIVSPLALSLRTCRERFETTDVSRKT